MKSESLKSKRGVATTEYLVISFAVLMILGTVAAGTTETCIELGQGNSQCESVLSSISQAMSRQFATVTLLLQLPF